MTAEETNKPPVMLVHGMWSTPEALDELREAFEQAGYSVEAPCLPLHMAKADYDDHARATLAQTRLQDYVAFLVDRVKQLDAPPILVGHSMGGLLAQLVAARVPCERLVLLSSAAPGGINSWSWSMVRTFGRNLLLFPLWKHVMTLRADSIRYGIANQQNADTQQWILDHATYESGMAAFQIGIAGFLPNAFSRVDPQSIQCPILVLGGTEDRITPIGIQRQIARKYGAQARLVEIPGACHWTVGGRYFDQVQRELFGWLDERAGEAVSEPAVA
ncbi:alpha-beta hydrolase superfamily lysophospholipase [Tamilnaduibacter salinus]|uniref:Alpha-beta hydrolase superfamily lysophospholipase n=1 Tax=Tamilnaduibacter salinus TaxID=1484056 RepID=A0A2U1CX85_9GAMM|nr:alpha/beta hydrolase [Tamilnaduibacter salinus]PVY76861.1 alpha-beta hydrolase superfamily lysophospholipase [Tamilnaduibacter salinus]